MSSRIQLRGINFKGPKQASGLKFFSGVNVVCGASDTGKSFLADSIDFMLGGSELRDIPESSKYGSVSLDLCIGESDNQRLTRSVSGGKFELQAMDLQGINDPLTLKAKHVHDKIDNLSGYLLDKIGLLGKRLLKSKKNGTTQSLSFRNLAKLIIVKEGEIQQTGSPFWGGQYQFRTLDIATIKLLLTEVDYSDVVGGNDKKVDNSVQIALLNELIIELTEEAESQDIDLAELVLQFDTLRQSIVLKRERLAISQEQLDTALDERKGIRIKMDQKSNAIADVSEMLARFTLLEDHYELDLDRLSAIRESGSMFVHVEMGACPICGADPKFQVHGSECDGDVETVVSASNAEIEKIKVLKTGLRDTVFELNGKKDILIAEQSELKQVYRRSVDRIEQALAPEIDTIRGDFSKLVEKRSDVSRQMEVFSRLERLNERKQLFDDDQKEGSENGGISVGIPDHVAHGLSGKIKLLLEDWGFPGDCSTFFDKEKSDFVIGGKARGSRGKGLRAITHAAINISLLEYCQEYELPHPGFVVLDSPLLAYYKPEGEDDLSLQKSDLEVRFYNYLTNHHKNDSQIIVIDNRHPHESVQEKLSMTVFTGNPRSGRQGFL